MSFAARAVFALSFRANRVGARLRSWYWRSRIEAFGGHVGRNFIVRARAHLELGSSAVVEIGDNVTIAEDAALFVGPGARLIIEERTFIGRRSVLVCNEHVLIGSGTQVAHDCTLIDADHRFDRPELPLTAQGQVTSPVQVGKETWIGTRSVVLKGVTLGERSVVGAGSIVTKGVAAHSVVAGNPARPIGAPARKE